MNVKFGIKTYNYDSKSQRKCEVYYVTINGRQVGPIHFTKKSVEQTIKDLKQGREWK